MIAKKKPENYAVEEVPPGSFEPSAHFYPKVLNAQIHPLVKAFLSLGNQRIAKRFCHLHPEADASQVSRVLGSATRYFQWAGTDLFLTTTERGQKRMVVIETNSCPSGQKSMPQVYDEIEHAGYRTLLERSFMPHILSNQYNGNVLPDGVLAVLYDKNRMEASGYAASLADLAGETVYLVPCFIDDPVPKVRVRDDGVLEIQPDGDGDRFVPVKAALRYVTKRPWSRIPPLTRTLVFNPVLACLAGGRNKMLAAKAYDLFNAEIAVSRLRIHTPDTIWDVAKPEIPLWVRRMGGLAVVKVPYAHAGLGVWTITNESELSSFMQLEHRYDRFIVQALIGNNGWSSVSHNGRLYHVGTIPNMKGNIYAADLRFMVGSSADGFFPVAIYARRARLPLAEKLDSGVSSWDMLGTNLSFKNANGCWGTETERLLLADSRDFNRIGVGLDELIEAYMQTVLAVLAIDGLACKLVTPKGCFGSKLFRSLNPDPKLLEEMYPPQLNPPLLPADGQEKPRIESNRCREENGHDIEEDKNEEKRLHGAPSFTEERLAAELQEKVGQAQSLQGSFQIAVN